MTIPRSPFRRSAARLEIVRSAAAEPEILLYDEIGYWGVTAKLFREELNAIDAPLINLRINSPGGDVFDGVAIHSAIAQHPARIVAYVDGGALSCAAYIAMAADEIRMADNAWMMIHKAWTFTLGNADELRHTAGTMDKIDDSQERSYMRKSGADLEQVRAWMAAETWYTAAEALAAGLVDSVLPPAGEEALDDIAARFDLSVFAHAPERLLVAAAERPFNPRDLERVLRDAGLSQVAAKTFVSAGRAAVDPQRDAGEPGQRDADPKPPGHSLTLAESAVLAACIAGGR